MRIPIGSQAVRWSESPTRAKGATPGPLYHCAQVRNTGRGRGEA